VSIIEKQLFVAIGIEIGTDNKYVLTVQLPTSADNVALLAFPAWLLLAAGPPAVQQSINISWPPGQ